MVVFKVYTTSFLYKLNWNDSVQEVFFNDLWIDPSDADDVKSARVKAFDETGLFELEFIGKSKASSVVMPVSNPFSKTPSIPNDVLELATVRNIDAVYAKLQKEYEMFKPMTPLYSVDPITARIGMKEGVEGGEKFEVLEQSIDPKTQRTVYKRKGVISVEKNLVWDNRTSSLAQGVSTDGLTEEQIEQMVEKALAGDVIAESNAEKAGTEANEAAQLGATTFKGGGKYYPGMLIRQLK